MASLTTSLRRNNIALLLLLVLVTLSARAQEHVVITDPVELSTGLVTVPMLDRSRPGFRVAWIAWDSPFRTTGLKVGDVITGLDQHPFVVPTFDPELQRFASQGPGQVAESVYWVANGKFDNGPVVLDVDRRGENSGTLQLEIAGAVAAKRRYFDAGQQRWLVGSGGPAELLSDGFTSAWSTWYDKFVGEAEDILDGAWERRSFDNRDSLSRFSQFGERLDYLKGHYPGRFTDQTAADYSHVLAVLAGTPYELPDGALNYRQLGVQRAAEIAAEAVKAKSQFIAALTDKIEIPSLNPLTDDRSAVVGKVVVLPPIPPTDWITDFGQNWLAVAPSGATGFFVSEDNVQTAKIFAAMRRYRSAISPDLPDTISIVGRLADEPRMLVKGDRTILGFEVVPIAASIEDKMFVDLGGEAADPLFAGESELPSLQVPDVPDDASPKIVIEAFILALKAGNQKKWQSLFADWRAGRWGTSNQVMYEPFVATAHDFEWVDARRDILGKVADAKVVYVGDPHFVLNGTEFDGAPRIEEVQILVDHIGAFDGAYRSFIDVTLHRSWLLQRRGETRWRIVSDAGL